MERRSASQKKELSKRFERAEGYVRRWKPMTLGLLELDPGRQTLKLQALTVANDEVANMRLLMFRRVE